MWINRHGFLFGLVLFVRSGDVMRYPWLEQVTRQEQLLSGCVNGVRKQHGGEVLRKSDLDHILVDHRHRLLYCYVPKVACTNWKRVFMVLTGRSAVDNLMDIPGSVAHADNSTERLSQLDLGDIRGALSRYTTFLMVRHPFERLLSAFRNKFENTYSHYFQLRYGRHIIHKYRPNASEDDVQSGRNVTFREFVQYLLTEGVESNEHWAPVYTLCHPCNVNYTFIGRYETLAEDSAALLDMVGGSSVSFPVTRSANTADRLRYYFQQLSIAEMQGLYHLYEMDFKLFGYNLEDLLGFDLA